MNTSLWYMKEANSFTKALPIGNGSLGAMVYGRIPKEFISLNIDTLWSGTGRKEDKKVDFDILNRAKKLSMSGEYYKATKLVEENLLGEYNESYLPLGMLEYEYRGLGKIDYYKRELDLEKAVISTDFFSEGISYHSEIFASYPSKAIVLSISSSAKGALSIDFTLNSRLRNSKKYVENTILLQGFAPSHVEPDYVDSKNPIIYDEENKGMPFSVYASIRCEDGKVSNFSDKISVRDASSISLILSAATGYTKNKYAIDFSAEKCIENCKSINQNLENLSFEDLLKLHLEDYQKLFYKSTFSLGEESLDLPTDERLKRFREGKEDLGLYCLYYHYGRYLLIASSRKGGEVANLQGIWSEELRPAWSSNWTININTQMNYWLAGICNLRECYEPLLNLLKDLSIVGVESAKKSFDCEGWLANHNIDIWRSTKAVAGSAKFAYWPMGGVWLCTTLFEFYRYTKDKDLLKKDIYPIISSSARFCLSWLVEGKDGYYHTPLSTSPENSFYDKEGRECYVSYSSTMDIALIKELFKEVLESIDTLNIKTDLKIDIERVYEKLPPYQIGEDAKLQEWVEDFAEVDKGHRHFSPLVGFFPGTTINEKENKDFIEAVRKFVEIRLENGGGHTGWSLAWIINIYARLGDGENALKYLRKLIANSSYDNLFDLHPPLGKNELDEEVFQIDGNFGGVSGIANMLLRCVNGKNEILPALPKEWKKGSISGLLDFDGKEVNISW